MFCQYFKEPAMIINHLRTKSVNGLPVKVFLEKIFCVVEQIV